MEPVSLVVRSNNNNYRRIEKIHRTIALIRSVGKVHSGGNGNSRGRLWKLVLVTYRYVEKQRGVIKIVT